MRVKRFNAVKTLVICFGPALEECGVQGDVSYD